MNKINTLVLSVFAMMMSVNILSSQQEMNERPYMNQKGPEMKAPGYGMERPIGLGPKAMKKWQEPKEVEMKVMEIVSKNDPAFAEKLKGLKKIAPSKYNQLMKVSYNLFELSENDETAEKDIVRGISLEFDVRELALKYNKASGAEKDKIKDEIKGKLNELFNIRTKIHELRIAKVESRLKELKSDLEKRKQNKSKIVEERLDDLIGSRALKW